MTQVITLTSQKVYTPAVVDNGYVSYISIDNWEGAIWDLIEGFITSYSKEGFKEIERQEDIITNFYHEHFFKNGVPDLDDVMCDVFEYNYDILLKIAAIDFANDRQYKYQGLTEDEYNNKIDDLADQWHESLYNTYFADLEEWVTEILNKIRYAYYEPEHKDIYNFLPNKQGLKLVYNECQNLINQEWIVKGMKEIEDEIPLNKIQVVKE
jgi:hypothetical protein